MQICRWYCISISLFLLFGTLPEFCSAKSFPAIAVLSQIKGKVKAGPAKKMVEGTNGLLLRYRQRVRTEKEGRATVFFKDGSEIRLFADTVLTVGARKTHNSRWARYRLILRSGSFWGHFVRGKNHVEISGGSMRLQLSNASIRFSKKKTRNDIAVTSGTVKVFNKSSFVKLQRGQRLYQIQKNDFMPQKVSMIPNELKLWIEPSEPVFTGTKPIELKLNMQVVRSGSDRKVERPGPVFLKGNYYNLDIPDSIRLNTDGNAAVRIKVDPPSQEDRTFEGSVTFHAIMDHSAFDDVRDGKVRVKLGSL